MNKALLLAATMMIALGVAALAHDAEHAGMTGDWIGQRQLQDPVWKTSCCGNVDCKPINEDLLRDTGKGYDILLQPTEFIELPRVIMIGTPDGGPWRCHFNHGQQIYLGNVSRYFRQGETRCLIVPRPPGV